MEPNKMDVIRNDIRNTPIKEYSMFIYEITKILEINPYLLISIMRNETNHFTNKLFTEYNSVYPYTGPYGGEPIKQRNIVESIHRLSQDIKYVPDKLIESFGSRENVLNHKIYGEYYKIYKPYMDKLQEEEYKLDKYTFSDWG